ncbi:MAG: ATP-binding cassette domain-containing protein [Nitrososphaerales archaeon]
MKTEDNSYAVLIRDARKIYPGGVEIGPVDIDIKKGEIFGLVGPNGAGKTTLLKIISGLIKATEGSVSVWGLDPVKDSAKVKEMIGYLPEEASLYENMTVESYLRLFADIFLVDRGTASRRIQDAYDLLGITGNMVIGDLSKGTRRKVAIARSLINDPELLIYDEPTAGLDVLTASAVIKYVQKLRDRGKSIMFSAHDMSLVETACDRVGVIVGGKIVSQGTVDEMVERYGSKSIEVEFEAGERDSVYTAQLRDTEELNIISEWLVNTGGHITNLTTRTSSLTEIFTKLVDEYEVKR